jgi:hypothetical protein
MSAGLKQVRVGSCPAEDKFFRCFLVDQQPVGLQMTITPADPIADERVNALIAHGFICRSALFCELPPPQDAQNLDFGEPKLQIYRKLGIYGSEIPSSHHFSRRFKFFRFVPTFSCSNP